MNMPLATPKPRPTTSAMIASIAAEGQRVQAAPFGKALVELAASRPDVVGMTADLAKYTDLHLFAQAHPERFFQMGMAEQLLMAAAGGMAKEGLTPFATTYAVFGTRRAYDFIHQVIAEENLDVKICCARSEEHTSELQSQSNLVCRLLLEKKKKRKATPPHGFRKDQWVGCAVVS